MNTILSLVLLAATAAAPAAKSDPLGPTPPMGWSRSPRKGKLGGSPRGYSMVQ
jgi:hypothetical protein